MPCTKVARGVANPAVLPPFSTPSTPSLPFKDEYENNPCGKPVCTMANGVPMDAHLLCLAHLILKVGALDVRPPYSFVP